MSNLVPNKIIFAEEWVKDRNGKRAAIVAGYSEKTAESQASRLLSNVKVKSYIDELLAEASKRRKESLDDILNELDENRKVALSVETPQASAANQATMAKAKLLGYVTEKQEIKHEGMLSVDIAPKLTKEEWMKAHGVGTTSRNAK